LKPSDFALASDSSEAALASESGLHTIKLEGFGSASALLDSRPNLLSPRFDRQGFLWSASSNKSPEIRVFSKSGEKNSLQTSAFAGHQILSFSVSPEGARLAAIVNTKTQHQIWLFGIIRNKKGLPTALSQKLVVTSSAINASGVSWLDGSKLGLLGQSSTGWSQPIELVIGGFEQQLSGYQGLHQFIGSNTSGARFALNNKGELLQFRGSTWAPIQSGIKAIHY
jgi:hypothetical protein